MSTPSPYAKPQGANANSYANPYANPQQQGQGQGFGALPQFQQNQQQGNMFANPNAAPQSPEFHNGVTPLPGMQPNATSQGSPYQALIEQLRGSIGGLDPSQFMTPYDQLQSMANSQVNAQYDPQISNLENLMNVHSARTQKSQDATSGMYNALSKSFADEIPQIQQQMKGAQDQTQQRYDQSKQQLQQQYGDQSNQQQAVLQNLGITAAAPGAFANMNADQKYLQGQQDLQNQQAQNNLSQQGSTAENYQRSTSDNARQTGSNRVYDLGQQLGDYLQQAEGQKSGLVGAKGQALQAMLGQLSQSNYERGLTSYNQQVQNLMGLGNMEMGGLNSQMGNQLSYDTLQNKLDVQSLKNLGRIASTKALGSSSGMSGLANYLGQVYPNNPDQATKVSNLVSSVMGNQDVMNGVHSVGGMINPVANTSEYLMSILKNEAGRQGINNPEDINNALDALLAYQGKLK